ncbi:MAG TPA: SDR family oxidoreductase [Dongiaceae bacterium]|jgi:NADP-dependent 3-hydroxy acid dehydrogenase YdfG|nr:SDR family oxidoreductase [Dongiaceae bacterium]
MDKPLVVITGASSGIGAATAEAFSKAGHPLLLLARRIDRMEALGLPDAICRRVDVRDRAAVKAAVVNAEAEYGPTDCLFNNAGIARLGNIITQDPEEWDEQVDINVNGVMNGVHAVMGGMVERKRGTIVNMSSIAGRKVYPDHTIYCGTKYFVHGMSDSLREHLAPHDVRVIVISPGVIETEVLNGVTDQTTLANYKANKVKIGGGISAEHVADSILFAYQMPQNVLIQEICITPTRQSY